MSIEKAGRGRVVGIALALLILSLAVPCDAGSQVTVLCKTPGGVPKFRVVLNGSGSSFTAVLQQLDGTPLCGPVPVKVLRVKRIATFSCNLNPNLSVGVTFVARGGVLTWFAGDSRGNNRSGPVCFR